MGRMCFYEGVASLNLFIVGSLHEPVKTVLAETISILQELTTFLSGRYLLFMNLEMILLNLY